MTFGRVRDRVLPLVLSLACAVPPLRAQQVCDWRNVDRATLSPSISRVPTGWKGQLRVLGSSRLLGPCTFPSGTVSITSSNVNVVRADTSGEVIAVAPGVAIVTAEVRRRAGGAIPDYAARALVVVDGGNMRELRELRPDVRVMPPGGLEGRYLPDRPPDLPSMPRVYVFRSEVRPVRPTSDSAWLEQAALVVERLDQTARRLTDVFRNAAGAPIPGATSPEVLSARERFRWEMCRQSGTALRTYSAAVRELRAAPLRAASGVGAVRAAQELEDALGATEVLHSCEEMARLLGSRERAADWGAAYTSAAARFYAGWYAELRSAHEAGRALAETVRALLPPERHFDVPRPLPLTPPTISKQ